MGPHVQESRIRRWREDEEEPQPLRFGVWLFYLTTSLTIATYIDRAIRTRKRTALP
ncbi:hypothetical protein [Streptomyces sp. NPDC058394]|uniref:hypothetical protein n=1 Tax=Streptomyces sp. NPDC058394 TaxID=3346477 RepID=UPI00364E49B8